MGYGLMTRAIIHDEHIVRHNIITTGAPMCLHESAHVLIHFTRQPIFGKGCSAQYGMHPRLVGLSCLPDAAAGDPVLALFAWTALGSC